MGLDLGNLLVHLRADASQYNRVLLNAEKRLKMTADRLTSIGKTMTMRVTAPIIAMGALVAKTGISLESAFIGVRKTVDATEAEFAALEQGFDRLALRMPITIEQLYGVGEAAGQLGIETASILGFTETMAQLGVTTNISSQEAATALARFANITQMSQDNFDRLGATIVDLGNNFATTEAEIVEMSLRIASAGKIAGLTESEILGISAALSSVGVQAQAGGTSIQKVLINMTRAVAEGSKELAIFAKVSGRTAKEFAELFRRDAAEAFSSFIEGLKRSGNSAFAVLEQLGLQDQRLIRSLLSLAGAGDLLSNSIKLGNKAWEDNTALIKEAELRFASTASQLRLFWNQVRLTAKSFKNILMPPVLDFLNNYVKPLLDVFKNLNDETKTSIVLYGLLASAIGPAILASGLLLKTLSYMISTVRILTVGFVGLGAAIASPLVAAVALVSIAYVLRAAWTQNLEDIKARMQEWFDAFKEGFDWLETSVVGLFITYLYDSFAEVLKNIAIGYKDFVADIAGLTAGVWAFLKETGFKKGAEAFAKAYSDTFERIQGKMIVFEDLVVKTGKKIPFAIKVAGKATAEHLEDLMDAVKTQFGEDADAIIGIIKSKIQSLQKTPEQILALESVVKATEKLKKDTEALQTATEDVVETTMTLADAYRAMRGEMGRMTKEVYEAQLMIIEGLRKEYEEAGVNAKALKQWYKEQAEVLEIEYLKSIESVWAGFKAAGMQIRREIRTWGDIAFEFSMTFRDSIASGLEATMRDFDNWKDHLMNIFEEIYWSAIRIALIQPFAGALACAVTGVAGSLFTAPAGSATNPFVAPKGSFGAPTAQHGGEIAKTGWAVVHKGETSSGVGGIEPKIDIRIHNEGSEKLEISKVESYIISDQRIIDVTTKAMQHSLSYKRDVSQASRS